jgi:hypothetical protein
MNVSKIFFARYHGCIFLGASVQEVGPMVGPIAAGGA